MSQTADRIGKLLFGRPLRLRVLLWVLDQDDRFFQKQATRGARYSSGTDVAQILESLVKLKMVRKIKRPSGNERQYYERVDSDLWTAIEAVRECL